MSRYRAFFVFGGLVLALGCSAPSDDRSTGADDGRGGLASPDAAVVDECPTLRHARHFRIECVDAAVVLRTYGEVAAFQTGRDAEEVEDVVVLVRRGATPPPLEGDLSGAEIVEVPVRSYAVNNDDILGLTLDLGVEDQLVAVGGLSVYDDAVRSRVESGELGQTGYSWHLPPDIEVLLERSPEVTFMAMDSPHNVPALGRSRDLGVTAAPTFVWAERHPLARAEWIRYFALFFGLDSEAAARFDEIEARYVTLRDRAAEVARAPTAIWGYHAGDGRWFVMANNLEARLLRDAGVENVFADLDDGTVRQDGDPVSSEHLLLNAADAEHWIIGDIHQNALPRGEFMTSFRSWRDDRLYHNYARSNWDVNAYDWYERATGRPDVALADLVHLFHPELLPEHELRYFGRFDREVGR